MKHVLYLIILLISIQFPVFTFAQEQSESPKREFRGVWVATVVNIDWPSKPGLSAAIQKEELVRIFDSHQQAGINAVLLQVRPTADAFYAKGREPWSRFLTGVPGQAPYPAYDPLEFAIGLAHDRGMELHAWFNPYRATFDLKSANTSADHITKKSQNGFLVILVSNCLIPDCPKYGSTSLPLSWMS